jgi:hypothetical protein
MRSLLHALSLALASAVTAEFLLGDQYLNGTPSAGQQVAQLVLFVAFYGSAAVLIRELARRAGLGWPGILTLALAFGVLEEGVLTQSLFDPDYVGQHLLGYGFVPWLGTAGPWLVFVLTLHVVWSIGSPIAVMEAAFGERPWFRAGWLAVPATFFVLGGLAIFAVSALTGGFMATGLELAISGILAVALMVVAFTAMRRRGPRRSRRSLVTAGRSARGSGYLASLAAGLVLSTGFQLAHEIPHAVSPWVPVAVMLAVLALGIVFAFAARPDALAFASGAILTYCWVGLVNAASTGWAAVVEQLVIVLVALAVLAVIAVRRRSLSVGRLTSVQP